MKLVDIIFVDTLLLILISMSSKPFSVRTQPWASFDRQSYTIIADDFVHEKLLSVKINSKPGKGAINLKNDIARKGDNFKSSGQIKLWFPIWNSRNGQLYFKSKNNEIKLHYDDGLKEIANSGENKFNYYNLYTSYQSDKTFKNVIVKAGANLLAKNYSFDNRIRVGITDSTECDVSSGHKFAWAKNNWSFDTYNVISYKVKALINNAIRVGYRQGQNNFFFRALNQTSRPVKLLDFANTDTYFTNFIFDYVRKIDDLTRVALEAEFTKKALNKTSFVLQRTIPNRQIGIKARLSSDRSVALSYQTVLKNYGKLTLGWQVSDLGQKNSSTYGVQVEVNL